MRQLKRLFYIVLLNIIISAITVGVVLTLWERDHRAIPADSTPVVIIVTPTQSENLPVSTLQGTSRAAIPTDTGVLITGTVQASPTYTSLTYQVKAGDTLGGLAVEFNISIEDIMTVNGITDPNSLYIGQVIHIPTAPLPKATFTSIPPTVESSATPRPTTTFTPGPSPTASQTQALQEAQVIIETVIGAGVLENERVVLQRTGDGELSLEGWRIDDGAGNEYAFPQLTLYKDGAINLNTRSGQDTVVDLFWNLTSPMWSPGKTVYLYDPGKTLRSSYTVP